MSLDKMSLYLLVVSISLGVFFNVFNVWGIMGALLLVFMVNARKRVDRTILVSVVIFALFILLKCWNLSDYEEYSVYFGIYKVIKNSLVICFLILILSMVMADVDIQTKCCMVRIFNICYYVSLVVSIILLMLKGRNTYRDETGAGGILLAPQIFVYYALLLSFFLSYMLAKGIGNRLKNSVFLMLNVVFLLLANYTTQILFMVLGMFLVLYTGTFNTKKKRIAVLLFLVTLIVLLFPYLGEIVRAVNNLLFVNNEIIYVRLNEMAMLLEGDSMIGSDIGARFDYMNRSFSTFANNMFLGVPFEKYNSVTTGIIVGGHSQWPDDLARLGLVGMFLWLRLILVYMNKIFYVEKHKEMKYLLFIIFGLYGFLNPYMSMPFLLMIYIGTVILQSEEWSKKA